MARRFHVSAVQVGRICLDVASSHHAKSVLRLQVGDAVELFDAASTGQGVIDGFDGSRVWVIVSQLAKASTATRPVHVASALPKGSRADWMIEKLSELGVARFTPLVTERAVVVPQGVSKLARWQRLAEEAARQCERAGVMQIAPPTPLDELIAAGPGIFCSTDPAAPALAWVASQAQQAGELILAVGPEGDFSPAEFAAFKLADWRAASLGRTILRVETAAIVAAVLATLALDQPPT